MSIATTGCRVPPNSTTVLSDELNPSAPVAVLDVTVSDGTVIRVRRHGNPHGSRLILSHGNGFAIDAYYPFWRLFLSDCEVIVYDQRNHGWNAPSEGCRHTQAQMADDLEHIREALIAAYGERRTAGAFHSLSTTVSLLHKAKFARPWDALILFDPPLAPPAGHRLHEVARKFEIRLHDWALQRQRRFASPDVLATYFERTRRMRRWVAGAAGLMARSITRAVPEGGVELVCPPEFEAAIYIQNANSPAWSVLPEAAADLLVVSSDWLAADADPPGLVSSALAEEFGIEVARVPDTGHLLQIERPEAVAKVVRDHLRSRGFPVADGR